MSDSTQEPIRIANRPRLPPPRGPWPPFMFAYGTLRHDIHGGLKEDVGHPIGYGYIEGRMHNLGAFPAVVPSTEATVYGQILDLSHLGKEGLERVLRRVDGYESCPLLFQRRLTDVMLDPGGTITQVWAYFFAAPERIIDKPIVPTGDWIDEVINHVLH